MGLLVTLALIVGGLITLGPDITRQKPEWADALKKLDGLRGYAGGLLLGSGIFGLIGLLTALTKVAALPWFVMVASVSIQLLLGFTLGFEIVRTIPFEWFQNPNRQTQFVDIRNKLAPYNTVLGLGALVVGILRLFG